MAATFDPGRRRSVYSRLARVVGRQNGSRDLLPLEEATKRLRPFARRHLGLRPIPLDQIVGTDSRGRDFDREFHPRRPDIRERLRRVERAFPNGDFPPIVVYQFGDAYFVIDGHHRVASARRQGMETIDAEVTELRARWHLPADADIVELVHAEQERIFMDESGLADFRPEISMRFNRPVGYIQLLETVQIHGYHLMLDAQRALPPADIAGDWYARVYVPTVEAIHAERLDEVCPEVTDADRFLWVYQRRAELVPEYGSQQLSDAARRGTEQLARERRGVGRLLRRASGRRTAATSR
ncbi:MAG: ParB N-terminal domain-containing protein [Gaiellaceae bacterium]